MSSTGGDTGGALYVVLVGLLFGGALALCGYPALASHVILVGALTAAFVLAVSLIASSLGGRRR